MIFMDMVSLKEIKFENRGGFANNFGRMKIKSVVIFLAVFSNCGFVSFLISDIEFDTNFEHRKFSFHPLQEQRHTINF